MLIAIYVILNKTYVMIFVNKKKLNKINKKVKNIEFLISS